jgi:hypothetical protein
VSNPSARIYLQIKGETPKVSCLFAFRRVSFFDAEPSPRVVPWKKKPGVRDWKLVQKSFSLA